MGMGVMYPDLKEDNPSKIVSGFGGTFCLVVSFVYIGMAVMMLGIGSPLDRLGKFSAARMKPSRPFTSACSSSFAGSRLRPVGYGLQRARNYEH